MLENLSQYFVGVVAIHVYVAACYRCWSFHILGVIVQDDTFF